MRGDEVSPVLGRSQCRRQQPDVSGDSRGRDGINGARDLELGELSLLLLRLDVFLRKRGRV